MPVMTTMMIVSVIFCTATAHTTSTVTNEGLVTCDDSQGSCSNDEFSLLQHHIHRVEDDGRFKSTNGNVISGNVINDSSWVEHEHSHATLLTVMLSSGARVVGAEYKGVSRYRGIRYAQAQRFGVPELVTPDADAVVNATIDGPCCPQANGFTWNKTKWVPSLVGLEDCLYLNVYTPSGAGRDPQMDKKAVMFWLHGGGFFQGTGKSNAYDFSSLVLEGDVIVVSINYRINVFGFFTPAEDSLPKNFGLRDQIAALQWVQRNIAGFGGDKNRVTIFGQSAGAVSVVLLYHSPLARGLFHRGIAQSTGVTPSQFVRPASFAANTMSKKCMESAGCRSLECLRSIPTFELMNACSEFSLKHVLETEGVYLAGYDGDVIPGPVYDAMCNGSKIANADLPLILGGMPHEWNWFDLVHIDSEAIVKRFLAEYLHGYAQGSSALQACAVKTYHDMYAGATDNCPMCRTATAAADAPSKQLAGDALFQVAHNMMAAGKLRGKQYHYLMDFADGGRLGPTHTSDLPYIFGYNPAHPHHHNPTHVLKLDGNFESEEFQKAGRMIRQYWASFAKTGVPTSNEGPTWEPVQPDLNSFLTRTSKEGPAFQPALLGLPQMHFQFNGKSAMSSTPWFNNLSAKALSDTMCRRLRIESEGSGACKLVTHVMNP